MPRAKRGFKRRIRRKKILKKAEGFVLGRKNQAKRTAEAVDRSFMYAYRDRRAKKRDFRGLWITRIGAAAEKNGTSYSQLISALLKSNIKLDRKILADIAISDPSAFTAVVKKAGAALTK